MGTVPFDCPHIGCLTKNIGMITHYVVAIDGRSGNLFGTCPVCGLGIWLSVISTSQASVTEAHKQSGTAFTTRFEIEDFAPRPPKLEAVSDLPSKIQQTYSEAEANFADGRMMSASIMYRKTVELTVKDLHPDGKGMLNARIRDLQKKEAVPDTLIALLDTVKFLGNEGAHDEDPPTAEDVERGRDFTRLFLVYSYELPARVQAALDKENIDD